MGGTAARERGMAAGDGCGALLCNKAGCVAGCANSAEKSVAGAEEAEGCTGAPLRARLAASGEAPADIALMRASNSARARRLPLSASILSWAKLSVRTSICGLAWCLSSGMEKLLRQ